MLSIESVWAPFSRKGDQQQEAIRDGSSAYMQVPKPMTSKQMLTKESVMSLTGNVGLALGMLSTFLYHQASYSRQ
jgi:hypothetical protein